MTDPKPPRRFSEKAKESAGMLCAFLGTALMAYAICLFCGQVVLYLRSGVWPPLSAVNLFINQEVNFTEDQLKLLQYVPTTTLYQEWLLHPVDWFGLHKIILWLLNGVSVPGLVLLLAATLGYSAEKVMEETPKSRTTEE